MAVASPQEETRAGKKDMMKKAINRKDFIDKLGSLYEGLALTKAGLEQARTEMEKPGSDPDWRASFNWWARRVETWEECILTFLGENAERIKEFTEEKR